MFQTLLIYVCPSPNRVHYKYEYIGKEIMSLLKYHIVFLSRTDHINDAV